MIEDIAGEKLKAGDMVTRGADGMWYKVRSSDFASGGAIPNYEVQSRCFESGADAMYQPAYDKGRKDEREALMKNANRHFSEWVQKEGVEKFGFAVKEGLWVFISDEAQ